MSPTELTALDARVVVSLLRSGEVTPRDLLAELETRIGAVDGMVNALPTLCFERAHAHADRLMQLPLDQRGPLAGLPVPIKDTTDVAGVRTTYGSPIFADYVPTKSDLVVRHLEAQGGIVYAKSEYSRIRRRLAHLQPGVRPHAQSVEHHALGLRLLGRGRCGTGHWHGLAGPGHRHGRLAAQPRKLLRHRRSTSQRRPRRRHARRQDRRHA